MANKSNNPLVSVIMPAYNCAAYVADALHSITQQTYKNLQIIIVDDCSTDNTWNVISEIARTDKRIEAYRNSENLKIVGTMNFAIRKAKGVYLARMDADDFRYGDSIEKQVRFLEAHTDVVIVGGASEICDENMKVINERRYSLTDKEIRAKLFRYSPYTHGSIVMRADVLEEDPYRLNWAEDYDLYFRLGNRGEFANLSDVVYKLRTHRGSVSRSKAKYQEKLTLYIRLKAVFEYGYSMSLADKVYFVCQYVSMFLMPSSFRFWLFNAIRRLKR